MSAGQSDSLNRPAFDALMWPTLKALKAMGGSASNDELLAKVTELEQFPDAIASTLHGDGRQTRLGYNLAWAKTYLKRGAVNNSSRGVWSITDEGERLSPADMSKVPQVVRRQDGDRRNGSTKEDETVVDAVMATDELLIEETWKDRLLTVLKAMVITQGVQTFTGSGDGLDGDVWGLVSRPRA